jgi:putative transposase
MAIATLTLKALKVPFLELNQNKVQEFESLQNLNTEIVNQILALPKEKRRKLTSKEFFSYSARLYCNKSNHS